ncbi:DNA helicase related protein [Amycolatopsis mediterranei S699]|uniref:DNA helicase related protein n=3 Tax=Amycolatopsis mediterranei TaxID=33910 RepID=A0A0H3D6V2_AMYMU|nr:AAA domain-containing protein [Amycolatopsis mediterranei]ADJ46371.1 DNA helicase related protein [Amycolatopsis mediterranei U32]AEK43165.1 DNA helicase related protein [Amycolatopsis mediterranei S699]AFO78082.1 DNA helicase related protein [Amycolatopsis mediterranei S699]AGT85210.1 DNA helicase related protein [Amycolatopsis mediterranei RB]KDO06390.1 DNA helicase [Amycolatopsis mediterranei]
MQGDDRARTVEFWRAVETLSPATAPKLDRRGGPRADQLVFDLDPREQTPWSDGHPLTARPLPATLAWQFTVYGGLYELTAIHDTLARAFGHDATPPDGRSSGQAALFAFTVAADGFLVEGSGALSACAFALGRLSREGPDADWLDGFEAEERGFADGLDRLAPPSRETRGGATAGKVVHELGEHAKEAAREAAGAGAKATGAAVTTAAATAVTSLAGPLVGGIAGAVAGTFAEKLLTPKKKTAGPGTAARTPRFELTADALHEFTAELAEALGITDALDPRGIRVHCSKVRVRDAADAGDSTFLNSFHGADLARIAKAVRAGEVGTGLRGFLSDAGAVPVGDRVDVRTTPQAVLAGVEPARLPLGRWPGDPARPLVLSQQFAVDRIMVQLGPADGLFAVNGPPGTGKTTLLRDVIAAVLVQRAQALAGLSAPADAFSDALERVKISERYSASVRALSPAVTGAEILVATSGNKAAANVTAEIPGVEAVSGAEEAAVAVDYFRGPATHVLDKPAWGLLAATLGNRKNCGQFAQRFWWGQEPAKPGDPGIPGMRRILRAARDEPGSVDDWATAVRRFRDAEATSTRLAAEREQVARALIDRPVLESGLREAEAALAQVQHQQAALGQRVAEARRGHAAAAAALQHATAVHRDHRADKPGFWVSLSTLFRAGRAWHAEHDRLRRQRDHAAQVLDQWSAALGTLAAEGSALDARLREAAVRLDRARYELGKVTSVIASAHSRWPGHVPDPAAFAGDDAFQLCAPWADPEFTAARNRVTLEALRLHKAFVLGAGAPMRDNLTTAAAVLGGNPKLRDETLLAVWQTLFLVVPVISTTFASLPRLFGRLGPEALGWLFIDEAGQATPQQTAGGIWRARRSVLVGDPQQLEPIVTLPSTAQAALLKRYRVAEEWLPDATSAQRVADRLNRFGTALPDPIGEGSTWVGAPLRVHRRCDRLMFEISNRIAYGGELMVYGTAERPPHPGRDEWIDVPATRSEGNWVPAEGHELGLLLDELAGLGIEPGAIRVVSPFVNVVRGAQRVVRQKAGRGPAAVEVGTVHTVQGQEADVVVIVLGSDPAKDGARRWGAAKPNLLNVAVSRAKRRLYVIGDRRRWQDQRYFDTLAAALPVRNGMAAVADPENGRR